MGSPLISEALNLPFLMPPVMKIIMIAGTSGLITIMTGLFASGIFALKAGHEEIHENLR